MSFVQSFKKCWILYITTMQNGVARVPILVGEGKDCALERVAIQPWL